MRNHRGGDTGVGVEELGPSSGTYVSGRFSPPSFLTILLRLLLGRVCLNISVGMAGIRELQGL